jgi:hypothetical protein
MDIKIWVAIIAGIAAIAGGIALDAHKHWSEDWLARRKIRRATQADLGAIVVSMNFFILSAIEQPDEGQRLALQYFGGQEVFPALDYYRKEKREALMQLSEWKRLEGWRERLLGIQGFPEPVLFSAIMLFEALTVPPLDKAVSPETMTVVRNTLGREDVAAYQAAYFRRAGGLDYQS